MPKKKTVKKSTKKTQKKSSSKKIFYVLILVALALGFAKFKNDPEFLNEIFSQVETTISQNDSPSNSQNESNEIAETTETTSGVLPKNLEIPVCAGTHGAKDHQRRDFLHYSLCYRESYEQAEWSAYSLSKEQLVKNTKRTDDFREDPEIKTGSATLADYRGSGFDRGHLTPAADMAFSKEAMSETFYMSNMSPQSGPFNRGIWRLLEEQVRVWAEKFGAVYVVSGPILDKKASELKKIGKSNVSVPERYYKVILVPTSAGGVLTIGFVLPNDECKGKKFWDFATSVASVEKETDLDFFSLLDDSIEKKAESSFDVSLWK